MACFYYFWISFVGDPTTSEFYTLSLHDALPIYRGVPLRSRRRDVPRADRRARGDGDPVRVAAASVYAGAAVGGGRDRKSTRLNSSHVEISYAVFCLKKKKTTETLRNDDVVNTCQ